MSSDIFVVQKAPTSVLDYVMDWAAQTSGAGDEDWLATGDTVSASTWAAQNGIVIGDGNNGAAAPSKTATTTTVWLMSGMNGVDYLVTNRIVTVGGRTHERSVLVQVRTR